MEKPFLGGGEQFGEIVLQASDHAESQIAGVVQKGGGGKVPIGDHIIGKTWAQVADGTAEKSPTGIVLAVPRAVGFHIQGQGQAGSHHTDHDQLMMVAEDLSFLVSVRDGTDRNPFPAIVRRRSRPEPVR